MKHSRFMQLLALVALCAAPALASAQEASADSGPSAPPRRGPRFPRVMPRGPKFDAMSPEDQEHVRRMAEFSAARDEATEDLRRLRGAIEARRAEILSENEEAKTLFEEAEALFAEYSAKTNALQQILENDEKIAGCISEMETAKALAETNQHALNNEAVAAMHRRMRLQREKAEAEGSIPPPPLVRAADPAAAAEAIGAVAEEARRLAEENDSPASDATPADQAPETK